MFFLPLCLFRVRSGASLVLPAHVQACLPSVGSIKQILNSKLVSFIEDHRESAEQSTKWHLTLRSYSVKHERQLPTFLIFWLGWHRTCRNITLKRPLCATESGTASIEMGTLDEASEIPFGWPLANFPGALR